MVPIRVATASVYHSDMRRPNRPHLALPRRAPRQVMVPRYLATEADARERYGDRLIEAVPGSLEVRYPDPEGQSMSAWR